MAENRKVTKMRIWKCDTNWDGDSLLEIFADFRIAFFGTDANRIGHYMDVKAGDLIGIAQGTRIVAVAEILCQCEELSTIGKDMLPRKLMTKYAENSEASPKAFRISSLRWLNEPIVNGKRMMRFFELPVGTKCYDAVKSAWDSCVQNPDEEIFDIDAGKRTLVSDNCKTGLFVENESGQDIRYVVPVYQRAYGWGENEVSRLLDDIAEGAQSGEPRFIGSIQVSAPRRLSQSTVSYELIDGQQRLTTILILLKCLGYDYTENMRTVVNAGSAQKDWDDFNDTFGQDAAKSFPLNKYIAAYHIIADWVGTLHEEHPNLTGESVVNYIKTKLIFVVIQTSAGISKTIQIFNVINTAGMDLNAADLFKIRFYEYLTKKTGPDETVFNNISRCYQKIDDYNKLVGYVAISMPEVMSFYQKVLVSQFKLNSELFEMGTQRFFERLFDYLLEGRKWPGFSNKDITLTLVGFEDVVNVLTGFESLSVKTPRLQIMRNFLWETRYGGIVYQFPALACYFNQVSLASVNDIVTFTERLFKKVVPSSLKFAKIVNDMRTQKLHKLLHALSDSHEELQVFLSGPWTIKGYSEGQMLDDGLNQDLVYSPRWKNLACKLAEFLLSRSDSEEAVEKRLFETAYDVEHIQSYTDKEDRNSIWDTWKWELNGLGNLSMLELSLNRSIQNDKCKKEYAYRQSQFASIKDVLPNLKNGEWSLSCARDRGARLIAMIKGYILDANK